MTRRAVGTSSESESEFTSWVRALALLGGFKRQYHTGDSRKQVRLPDGRLVLVGDKDAKGWLDWVFINEDRGILIIAELKKDGSYATPEQRACISALRACGVAAYCWAPRDRPEIEEVFLRRR